MSVRKRISVKSSVLTRDIIKSFILHCKAKGLADKTIATYEQQFSAIEKHAYLLSGELATLLSGRYIEIKMLPLSFKEYRELRGSEEKDMTSNAQLVVFGAVVRPHHPSTTRSFVHR